jgi:hypothetical protein
MVLQTLDAIQSLGFTVVRIWAFNDGPGWMSLQPQAGEQCTREDCLYCKRFGSDAYVAAAAASAAG